MCGARQRTDGSCFGQQCLHFRPARRGSNPKKRSLILASTAAKKFKLEEEQKISAAPIVEKAPFSPFYFFSPDAFLPMRKAARSGAQAREIQPDRKQQVEIAWRNVYFGEAARLRTHEDLRVRRAQDQNQQTAENVFCTMIEQLFEEGFTHEYVRDILNETNGYPDGFQHVYKEWILFLHNEQRVLQVGGSEGELMAVVNRFVGPVL